MFACLLCILGGLRFVIANLFYNLSKEKENDFRIRKKVNLNKTQTYKLL